MQQAVIENILNGDLDAYEAVVRQYHASRCLECQEWRGPDPRARCRR